MVTCSLSDEESAYPFNADRLHLRQNWWTAARPLSGSDQRKWTFVQAVGAGDDTATSWWIASRLDLRDYPATVIGCASSLVAAEL